MRVSIILIGLILAAPAAAEVTRITPPDSDRCFPSSGTDFGHLSARNNRFVLLRCDIAPFNGPSEYFVYDLQRRRQTPIFTQPSTNIAFPEYISPNGRYVVIHSTVALTPEPLVSPRGIYRFDVVRGVFLKLFDDFSDLVGSGQCPSADITALGLSNSLTISNTGVVLLTASYSTAMESCVDTFAVD